MNPFVGGPTPNGNSLQRLPKIRTCPAKLVGGNGRETAVMACIVRPIPGIHKLSSVPQKALHVKGGPIRADSATEGDEFDALLTGECRCR
jgi:hypothetical protein